MLQINEMAMGSVVQARHQGLAATMKASRRPGALGMRLGVALIRLGESMLQECRSTTDLVTARQQPRMSEG